MDNSRMIAQQIKEAMEMPGFKIIMSHMEQAAARAQADCALGNSSFNTSDQIAMDIMFKRGILRGMREMIAMKDTLLKAYSAKKIEGGSYGR